MLHDHQSVLSVNRYHSRKRERELWCCRFQDVNDNAGYIGQVIFVYGVRRHLRSYQRNVPDGGA